MDAELLQAVVAELECAAADWRLFRAVKEAKGAGPEVFSAYTARLDRVEALLARCRAAQAPTYLASQGNRYTRAAGW